MNKTVQVVMLSTEKISPIAMRISEDNQFKVEMSIEVGTLFRSPSGVNQQDITSDCQHQHLYLVSDEEIKEGEWLIQYNDIGTAPKLVAQCPKTLPGECVVSKIIATTDKSLVEECNCGRKENDSHKAECKNRYTVPQIPESFIKAYVEAKGKIDEVQLEYEELYGYPDDIPERNKEFKLKLRDEGTIIIYRDKQYSREDMHKAFCAGGDYAIETLPADTEYYRFMEYMDKL